VNANVPGGFEVRLHRVAVDFVVPGHGPRIDEAVILAEDLVASGFTGDATVEVAALRRDAIRSDAEPLVRNMLAECGIDLPTPQDEDAEYRLLLKAFGFWDLPIADFYSLFVHRLPSWDQQDALERTLVQLFDDLDHATHPAQEPEIVQRMRAAVRSALA
jgi:hypothetical protein